MDYKVEGDMMFSIIKNVIIEQNKHLLIRVAKRYKKNPNDYIKKYLRPEFYLPLIKEEK